MKRERVSLQSRSLRITTPTKFGIFPSSWVDTWDVCVTCEDNVRGVACQDIGEVDPIKLILDVIHCFLRLCKGSPLEIIWVAGKHLVEIICYERCRGPTVSRISRNKYKRDYNQSTIDLNCFAATYIRKRYYFRLFIWSNQRPETSLKCNGDIYFVKLCYHWVDNFYCYC